MVVLRPSPEQLTELVSASADSQKIWQTGPEWPNKRLPRLAILMTGDSVDTERIIGIGVAKQGAKDRGGHVVWLTEYSAIDCPLEPHSGHPDPESDWLNSLTPSVGVAGSLLPQAVEPALAFLAQAGGERVSNKLYSLLGRITRYEDDSDRGRRWREERDALILFCRIAGIEKTVAAKWKLFASASTYLDGCPADQQGAELDRIIGEYIPESGGSLCARLLRNKDTNSPSRLAVCSMISPAIETGANSALDAIYYHEKSKTLVVLPYLRENRRGLVDVGSGRSVLSIAGRLRTLDRRHCAHADDDLRFLSTASFVHVAKSEPFVEHATEPIMSRIYPFAHVEPAIAEAARRGEAAFTLRGQSRHLTHTSLWWMVRDGWIGARPVPRDEATEQVRKSLDTSGAVLLAVDLADRPRANNN